MAIQFNCPYCTTPIRVPDSAGGKRGTCPRCRTPILVPKVKAKGKPARPEPEAEPEQPTKPKKKSVRARFVDEQPDFSGLTGVAAESDAAAAPPAPEVVAPPQPAEPSPPSLPLQAAATGAKVDTPYTRALQRRRKRRRFVWVPVLFGALLVGGAAVFFLVFNRRTLEGTLNAVVVSDPAIESRTVRASMTDAKPVQIAAVAKNIREAPYSFRDPAGFVYEVTTAGDDLKLRVQSTGRTPLVRVDVQDNEAMRAFFKENGERLDEPRLRAIRSGLNAFFEGSAKSLDAGGQIPTEMTEVFRRKVAANTLVGVAGYNLIAVTRGKAFLCFYEDDKGRLYFPLPRGTKTFTLKGRKLADGTRAFPGSYTVHVEGTPGTKSPPKTEPKSKTPAGKTAVGD